MQPLARHSSLSDIAQTTVRVHRAPPPSPVCDSESTSQTIFVHCTPSSSNISVLKFMRETNLVSTLTRRSSIPYDNRTPSSAQRPAFTLPGLRHRTPTSYEEPQTHSASGCQLSELADSPGCMADKESLLANVGQVRAIASSSQRNRASSFGMDPWAIPARVYQFDVPTTPTQMASIQPVRAATSQKLSRQRLKDGIRNGLPEQDIQNLLANVTRGPSRWQSASADRQWRTRRLMEAVKFLKTSDSTKLDSFVQSLGICEKELKSCIKNMIRSHRIDTDFSQPKISLMLEVLHKNFSSAQVTSDHVAWGLRRQDEIQARFTAEEAHLLVAALFGTDLFDTTP